MNRGILFALHAANAERQIAWTDGTGVPNTFRALETIGECGEVANVIKKLERERYGWRGSRADLEMLADELADVVICLDLLAAGVGEELPNLFDRTSAYTGAPDMLALHLGDQIGKLAVIVAEGYGGDGKAWGFVHALNYIKAIAAHYGINMETAIQKKFNETTHKVKLNVFLGAPLDIFGPGQTPMGAVFFTYGSHGTLREVNDIPPRGMRDPAKNEADKITASGKGAATERPHGIPPGCDPSEGQYSY